MAEGRTTELESFIIASYLLGKGDAAMVCMGHTSFGKPMAHLGMAADRVGVATGPARRLPNGVWRRDFTRAVVLVNPQWGYGGKYSRSGPNGTCVYTGGKHDVCPSWVKPASSSVPVSGYSVDPIRNVSVQGGLKLAEQTGAVLLYCSERTTACEERR